MKIVRKILIVLSLFVGIITIAFKINASNYNEDDLENGILEVNDFVITHYSELYTYEDIVFEEDYYILIGSYKSGKYNQDHYMKGYSPYISYNVNEEMIWDRGLYEYGLGTLESCVIYDDYIYVIGNTMDYHGNINPIIIKFDLDGKKIADIRISSNNETDAKKIVLIDGYLCIVGWSMATDFIPVKSNLGTVFVMRLDLDLNLMDKYFFGSLDSTDELINVCYNEELIYIYAYFGRGSRYDEGYAILRVNSRLDECGMDYVNQEGAKFIKCFDGIAFLYFSNKNNRLVIEKYDWLCNLKGIYSLEVTKINSDCINFVTFCNNDNLYVGIRITRAYKKYIAVGIIDKDFNVISSFEYSIDDNNYINSIHVNSSGIYIFDSMYKNKIFHASRMKYLKKIDDELYYNGYKCNKEIETCNDDYFGTYDLNVRYRYKDEEFITNYTYVIKPDINVINGETYELGYVLRFNGDGYLNEELISNNYVLDKEGIYTLKVIGKNNELLMFTFSVKKIAIDISSDSSEVKNVSIINNKIKEVKELKSIVYENNEESITQNSRRDYLFIVAGVSVLMFIV